MQNGQARGKSRRQQGMLLCLLQHLDAIRQACWGLPFQLTAYTTQCVSVPGTYCILLNHASIRTGCKPTLHATMSTAVVQVRVQQLCSCAMQICWQGAERRAEDCAPGGLQPDKVNNQQAVAICDSVPDQLPFVFWPGETWLRCCCLPC